MKGYKNKQNVHETPFITYDDTAAHGTHASNSVYHTTKLLKPSNTSTNAKAPDNNQLIGFPPITSAQVRKYLPESTTMAKGLLRRVQKHTRSTTKMRQKEAQVIEHDFRPAIDANIDFELFIGATIAEHNDGTIYTDQTGNVTVTSYHGNRCQFVAYEYRRNTILV
eukprot:CCRYP_014645-RA/>CCRYP_014645-RA protein AED:0.44 eAED:0.44 QI:0/0/0/1/0/0/2/0/165